MHSCSSGSVIQFDNTSTLAIASKGHGPFSFWVTIWTCSPLHWNRFKQYIDWEGSNFVESSELFIRFSCCSDPSEVDATASYAGGISWSAIFAVISNCLRFSSLKSLLSPLPKPSFLLSTLPPSFKPVVHSFSRMLFFAKSFSLALLISTSPLRSPHFSPSPCSVLAPCKMTKASVN